MLDVLRDGHAHDKAELVRRCGVHERAVRAAIASLRLAGWPIASSSGSVGYRLSFDTADLLALERDLEARALSALRVKAAVARIRQRRAS